MFEKEAEKWTIDYVCKDCSRYKECKSKEHCTCKDCSKEKWQKGAEFGYNKCKEELKKIGLALQSDMDKTIEQNIALKKENAELKKLHEMSNKVYNDNLDYSHHIEGQLTKAKELLTKWAELFKPKGGNIPPTPIQVETEQFISEVEK